MAQDSKIAIYSWSIKSRPGDGVAPALPCEAPDPLFVARPEQRTVAMDLLAPSLYGRGRVAQVNGISESRNRVTWAQKSSGYWKSDPCPESG
jgi:hypothetical protein